MYTPLDTAKRQIRPLHLNHGDDSLDVSGALLDVLLNEEPEFEAISYVWPIKYWHISAITLKAVNLRSKLCVNLERPRSQCFQSHEPRIEHCRVGFGVPKDAISVVMVSGYVMDHSCLNCSGVRLCERGCRQCFVGGCPCQGH